MQVSPLRAFYTGSKKTLPVEAFLRKSAKVENLIRILNHPVESTGINVKPLLQEQGTQCLRYSTRMIVRLGFPADPDLQILKQGFILNLL